jgi:hypothetical protein
LTISNGTLNAIFLNAFFFLAFKGLFFSGTWWWGYSERGCQDISYGTIKLAS